MLADFDELELSNLNRVPATVFDLGENKAVVAARRIAELDPYLDVQVLTAGLTTDTMAEFLSGLDVVVEECDARHEGAGAPVRAGGPDSGGYGHQRPRMVDVERFDLEPDRPILRPDR